MKSRSFSVVFAALIGVTLGAGGSAAQETLRVGIYGGVWEDYVKQGVIANFEKATGAKVVVEVSSGNQFLAKLRAGGGTNPPYDLLPLQPYSVEAAAAGKLIIPIDTSRLKNFADLSPALVKQMSVDGKMYAQPFTIASLVLAYRTDMVTTPPTSWADLFNPAYKNCGVAVQPPSTTGGGTETLSGLAKALGGSEADPATMDKVFQLIEENKDNVVAFPASTADNQTLLQRGDVCLAAHHDGRIIQMRESGIPVALATPKEGGIAGMNGFAITAGSPNVDLAYKFLDFASDPESQAVFGNQIFYAMSNLKTPYSEAFLRNRPDGVPDFDKLIWLDTDLMTEHLPEWQARWEKIYR